VDAARNLLCYRLLGFQELHCGCEDSLLLELRLTFDWHDPVEEESLFVVV
jgi:hypothetical protein